MSNIRTQTTLVCGALAIAIAVSTLLRGRVRPVHLLFAGFALDIGLWYLSQSLFFGFSQAPIWQTAIAILAVALPQLALRLFEAMVPHEDDRSPGLLRFATLALVLAVPLVGVLSMRPASEFAHVAIFLYVFVLLTAGLWTLGQRGRASPSRDTQRRVRFLVVVGAAAGLASTFDFAWFITESLGGPPVGAVLSIVFLFLLAEGLRQERLLDLYELLARLLVATSIAFLIAFIFYVLAERLWQFRLAYLNIVLAAIVVILIFDPLRERVEATIQRLFFSERLDLELSLALVRNRLAHVLEVDDMGATVMAALDQSRRVTGAGLYIRDPEGSGFDLLASRGQRVPRRVEVATARALLDRLDMGPLAVEDVEREVAEHKALGERTEPGAAVLAAASVLGSLSRGVVLAIRDEAGEVIGLLVVTDDRARDAFAAEEVSMLATAAAQIGVVMENSRVYAKMKERDRLAVLGQMAAGLAHEIRNPLGAIKGAAQLLADPSPGAQLDPSSREFLGIILEEVDRLDRVVGSVLDLARPQGGGTVVVPTDVNAVVRRTLQVLSAEQGSEEVKLDVILEPTLPRVVIDPEQLRQVLMNLLRNASQAMKGRGKVTVSTRVRFGRGTRSGGPVSDEPFVELTVADNGPGLSQKVLENLFMPFFTTKEKGTGLGLAISQRIVQGAGGRIDVRSYEGKGSTFAIVLPAAPDALTTPTPTPALSTGIASAGIASTGSGKAGPRPNAPGDRRDEL